MTATKSPSPAMAFLVESLKKDKKASYGDLKAAADKKGLAVFPIMFGRVQALLGIVKSAKRGTGKSARAKAAKTPGKAGRPAEASSKSGQIRALLGSGMSVADIAKKVGCTTALVYNVKSASGTVAKRGPGRPPKVATKPAGLDGIAGIAGIVAAVQSSERNRAQMRAALERIQGIIADAIG